MAKKSGKDNDKQTKKRREPDTLNDGEAKVRRAEKRLARALTEVDAARDKVARRERDLGVVLARYGRIAPAVETEDIEVPAGALSRRASGSEIEDVESVAADPEPAMRDRSEQQG